MDPDTVSGLVMALVSAYNAGLEYYTKWQRRQWFENHYATHDKGNLSGGGCCALSTSFGYSGPKIREAFEGRLQMLGKEYDLGDERCLDTLRTNLEQLQSQVNVLEQHATAATSRPMALFAMIKTSEGVRVSTLLALKSLATRIIAGDYPLPRELDGEQDQQVTKRYSDASVPDDEQPRADEAAQPHIVGSQFPSEPPSPPMTPPKKILDEEDDDPSELNICNGSGKPIPNDQKD
ncbi:hypothetical protein BX600DRAFT_448905 [Xylariales sp. PMI_506]|nr:hypothetical protein BX600DRAFT_448905 [Xylariales sp. PMI_506]